MSDEEMGPQVAEDSTPAACVDWANVLGAQKRQPTSTFAKQLLEGFKAENLPMVEELKVFMDDYPMIGGVPLPPIPTAHPQDKRMFMIHKKLSIIMSLVLDLADTPNDETLAQIAAFTRNLWEEVRAVRREGKAGAAKVVLAAREDTERELLLTEAEEAKVRTYKATMRQRKEQEAKSRSWNWQTGKGGKAYNRNWQTGKGGGQDYWNKNKGGKGKSSPWLAHQSAANKEKTL